MPQKAIPDELLRNAISEVETGWGRKLPFYEWGIKIDKILISTTLEILNEAPSKTLPQNSRNAVLERTPDGLDRRLKERLGNLRRGNIISDVLSKANIVEVFDCEKYLTQRLVKCTRLCKNWRW